MRIPGGQLEGREYQRSDDGGPPRRLRGSLHAQAGDDTTVATVKAIPEQIVSLYSGPPRFPQDDERAVVDFMSPDGLKIVCGGSSANLVARVLGREVTTDLSYDDDLPPIAHIKGIDLVTEGSSPSGRPMSL